MEIVTGEPAPSVERDQAAHLLLEMAAVVRTILGAPAPVAASVPTPAPKAPTPSRTVVPPPLAGLPVPSLAVPLPADPEERRSLALLQEIAFLDE